MGRKQKGHTVPKTIREKEKREEGWSEKVGWVG
jgi:hypothetical protein